MANSGEATVLLVDDEQDITLTMKKGLQQHGFKVEAFNDPVQASSKFKPAYYDAIILDVKMPKMNGFELARKIWAIDPNAKVCFFSAFEIYEEEAKIVLKHLKTSCFVKKPVTPSVLAEHINKHMLQMSAKE